MSQSRLKIENRFHRTFLHVILSKNTNALKPQPSTQHKHKWFFFWLCSVYTSLLRNTLHVIVLLLSCRHIFVMKRHQRKGIHWNTNDNTNTFTGCKYIISDDNNRANFEYTPEQREHTSESIRASYRHNTHTHTHRSFTHTATRWNTTKAKVKQHERNGETNENNARANLLSNVILVCVHQNVRFSIDSTVLRTSAFLLLHIDFQRRSRKNQ